MAGCEDEWEAVVHREGIPCLQSRISPSTYVRGSFAEYQTSFWRDELRGV